MANNANATKKNPDDGPQVKVKNYSPGYMEQATSRGHEASPQSGLCVGCKLRSSSEMLRGLGVRAQAQARRISSSLLFSALGVSSSSFLPPPRSAMRRGTWKCNRGPRLFFLIVQATAEELHRVYIANRDINPGYVERCTAARPRCGVGAWI